MKNQDIMTHREFTTKAKHQYGEVFEPNNPDEVRMYKNAAEVLSMIRDGMLKPSELSAEDRRPVVAYLRIEGYSKEEMSRLFEVSSRTIAFDLAAVSKSRVKIMKGLSLLEVAGRLYENARYLARKARREGSYATSWKIEKELVESLQSLGFIYRAPKTMGIAALHGNIKDGHLELNKQVGEEKDKVVDALGTILDSLGQGRRVRLDDTEQRSDKDTEVQNINSD